MQVDDAQTRLLDRFERACASPRLMMLYPPICTGVPYDPALDARELWRDATGPGTLYVHIPFCATRCGFCPFYAVIPRNGDCEDYVATVLAEAALYAPAVRHLDFTSVYLGGGTPSLLAPRLVERLLRGLGKLLRIEGADVTLEAHPLGVDEARLGDLCAAGTTRLSLGVQSFDRDVLEACGRGETADAVRPAVEAALDAPLRDVNVDLMYGLPGQTSEVWLGDLDTATRMGIPSLTLYATVYLPSFQSYCDDRRLPVASAAERAAMYDTAYERLTAAGHRQPRFGAGAFTRGDLNPHRRNVARARPTLGLGTWAYSSSGRFSYHNRTPAADWARDVRDGRLPVRQVVAVAEDERRRKHVVEALLLAYLDLDHFRATWGVELAAAFPAEIAVLERLGLTKVEERELRLTPAGARRLREIRYLFASPPVVEALEASGGQGL